jgi:rubredoxin
MPANTSFAARWACPHCHTVYERDTFMQEMSDSGSTVFLMYSQQPVCPRCKNILDHELLSSGYYDIDKSEHFEESPASVFFAGFLIFGAIAWGIASIWSSFPANFIVGVVVGCVFGLMFLASKKAAKPDKDARTAKALLRAQERVEAEKTRRNALPKLGPADLEAVQRLISAYPGYLPRREGVVRDIGRELNARGGFKLMQAVHTAIADQLSGGAARQLEMAWGGIGEWQS